jgi:pRiA4b ORF-3-like protein
MARTKRSMTPVVYQIKITLKGSKPPIWRRMQISSATTLAQLHRILQRVMGWEGHHLYRFVVGGMEYGDPSMLEEMEGEDARRVTLATLVRGEKDKFLYEYDFGDSWDHELLNELPRSKLRGIKPPLAYSHGPASLAGWMLVYLVDVMHAHLRTIPTGRLGDAVAYSFFHCPAAAHIGE